MNILTSFVVTLINVIFTFINFIKGPVALVIGVGVIVFALASPAEAAIIKCNSYSCPPVGYWQSLSIDIQMSIICLFLALLGVFVLLLDRD